MSGREIAARLGAAAVMAALALPGAELLAQDPFDHGTFRIGARHSRRCIEVPGESAYDGAVLGQGNCHGGYNQRFRTVRGKQGLSLVALHSGKCLTVLDETTGTPLRQYACEDERGQHFERVPAGDGHYLLRTGWGSCLEVEEGRRDSGARIVQAPCSADSSHQQWTFW